jgi:triphosphoribosyl-dephospho-CoA synthase
MTALNPFAHDAGVESQAVRLAALAVDALVDEAMLTPKPGLVDMRGSGSHTDLTWLLMCRSACALQPSLLRMAQAGAAIANPFLLRRRIGAIGREAEAAMMAATGGVNTHRGAIWALGLLVTAAARCGHGADGVDAAAIAACAGELASIDDPGAPGFTGNKGALACRTHGVTGARGQACAGFPAVLHAALPMLRLSRARGDSEAQARINALLAVMRTLDDTCLLARGGRYAMTATQSGARRVLDLGGVATPGGRAALAALEARMRRLHVSPGGAADLLAAALLLDSIEAQQA